MVDYSTQEAADIIGGIIWNAVTAAQNSTPRNLQTANRILGMSQLGGCREYIRATVAGDSMDETHRVTLKWPAYVGTAVGDKIEADVKAMLKGTVTQHRVTLFLQVGEQTISVSGSTDILIPDQLTEDTPPAVIDLKTRDGLAEIRREGPPFKEKVQIAGYLLASIDEGLLPAEAIGMLFYIDRSGRDSTYHVWAVDREQALLIMEAVSARLQEVAASLATGRRAPRDEPESWCFHVGCPFYNACWAGYEPDGEIDHPDHLEAIRVYLENREEAKAAQDRMRSASGRLKEEGVAGITADGVSLNWVLQQNGTTRIDIRRRSE